MFVEQLSWLVKPGSESGALQLLSLLHDRMNESGGLIRAMSGSKAASEEHLVSLTFWKSWEDLSRFLSSADSGLLTQTDPLHGLERPHPHHYEIVRDWPKDAVDVIASTGYWVIHEFIVDEQHLDSLMDKLRHLASLLAHRPGLISTGVWLDKSNPTHIALASQWTHSTSDSERNIDLPSELPVIESTFTVYKLHLSNVHRAGVV